MLARGLANAWSWEVTQKAPWDGQGWYWELGFSRCPQALPWLCFTVPNQACHLAGTTREVGYVSDMLSLPHPSNLISFSLPPPSNCENSGKLTWENKHVLTIWDAVQLTAISNIYSKILTPISMRTEGGRAAALHIKCVHIPYPQLLGCLEGDLVATFAPKSDQQV